MTTERLNTEILYHASLAPFQQMHKSGIITDMDLIHIEECLRRKYSPIFISQVCAAGLDKCRDQR